MSTSRIKSAERALDVLDLLARRSAPLSAAEIGRELDLPKSTTHHLLNVMGDRRFLTYLPDERAWTLGISAFEVGAAYLRGGALQRDGQRFLAELTRDTGETSHLAVLQGTEVLYLDKREPTRSGVRLVTEVGTRLPAHLTAVGRAILAAMDDAQVDDLYAGYDWPTRTGAGPTGLAALHALLAADRTGPVTVERDSTTVGITCFAAPVSTRDGSPVAALGIAFLTGSRPDVDDAEGRVADAATEFSRALSGTADTSA